MPSLRPAEDVPSVMPSRAEMLAALSLAIDLGLRQPMEDMLRSCLLAMRLADEIHLDEERCATVCYATLLARITALAAMGGGGRSGC